MIDDPEIPRAGLSEAGPGRTRWRVWAPKASRVDLVLGLPPDVKAHPMEPEGRGFLGVTTDEATPGLRYAYSLDGKPPLPDPASRSQPDGVDAPSAAFDPGQFNWDEGDWKGIDRADLVIYELHVGTFTSEGTFDAILPRLESLKELGITAVELMPVAQFPGERSWGYDGVLPFAVQSSYGGPEGLRRLVEACHRAGLAVILDVIYNHFGPEGNHLPEFGDYLTDKYKTAWGPALNFDDRGCDAVRAMVLDNVRMWIGQYRCDGLRLDAADQILDRSPRHILSEIAEVAQAEAARLGRVAHVFAETDQNDAPRYLSPVDRGGYGLDGHWTDDFHHAVHATLTGESAGYYEDFADGPASLVKVLSGVFVNDGRYSLFRGRRHGAKAEGFSGDRFVAFTQNHDQVGNRARSDRQAASLPPAAVRLAAGILLLAPRLPLIFMGQEYGETRPFPFFCDFRDPGLVEAVRKGRKDEFAYFGWKGEVADPLDPSTRDSAVLSWSWPDPVRSGLRRLYKDLLLLRQDFPALRNYQAPRVRLLAPQILEMIWAAGPGETLTACFNLGPEPWDGSQPPVFRSESEAYGADIPFDKTNPNRLAPWEFALFGPARATDSRGF